MANKTKNNVSELHAEDDDPTAELELPTFAKNGEPLFEVDAKTYDARDTAINKAPSTELESDLQTRERTISRLQFDIEQLRSKWLGLEAEINAREAQTENLNEEIARLNETVERKDKLLRKRDQKTRSLKSEIRERETQYREIVDEFDALREKFEALSAEEQVRASEDRSIADLSKRELIERLHSSEEYADGIRHQLQDVISARGDAERQHDRLQTALLDAERSNERITDELKQARILAEEQQTSLDRLKADHDDEIRTLRFELGEAEQTATDAEQLNSQLASDLVDTRGSKDDLKRRLSEAEDRSNAEFKSLQKKISKLTRKTEDYEQKLATKSEAITALLAELAKKTEQIESIGEIENVIHEIDDRITERIDPAYRPERTPTDRLTRVLTGTIEGQELRFPLFKDRLTVGRGDDNDIQLKAPYISRRHAVIQTERDVTRIIDWGSKNGIYVNETRVKEYFLGHGDIVTIGNARFCYEERKKRDA